MATIKNILFDLGDVLINIDFKKVKAAFENLGIQDFDQQFSQLSASSLFEELETGKVTAGEFYRKMQLQSNLALSEANIKKAWNAILLDFREESMKQLVELKKNYRLFLLSNTNAIHLEEVNMILHRQLGVENLNEFFDKAYYSHLVGLRKPHQEIFEFVLKDAGITAAETIFIDDTPPNITTASTMGFQTHLLLPGERIERLSL